jgi:ABC-type antimicrobial peptide transport system permease subunit
VLTFFGAAALVLSGLSIYGLVSFIAASRVREVGIRMALAATRIGIAMLVVSDGLGLTAMGVTIGILASLLLSHLLSGLLSEFDLSIRRRSCSQSQFWERQPPSRPSFRPGVAPRLQPMKALKN